MQNIIELINSDYVDNHIMMQKAIISIICLIISFLALKLIKKLSERFIDDDRKTNKVKRTSRLIISILCLVFIINLWFSHTKFFGIFVALVLAFIALATKDIILDVVAYIYIMIRAPFTINNVIEIEEYCGEVVDIDFLQFNLAEMGDLTKNKTHTGRYISIPNRSIFDHAIVNYNHSNPFVVVEVSVLISFDADRQKALKLAGRVAYDKYQDFLGKFEEDQVKEFDKKMKGLSESKEPKIRANLDANGFLIYIQFFTPYDEIGKNKMIMQNALYDSLKNNNIELPVPKYVRFEE